MIKTEKEYQELLIEFEKVFDSKIGTVEGDRAEKLANLILDWECKIN